MVQIKKTSLLHTEISKLIAGLGHYDAVVIADVGLPVPPGVKKIDLALTKGVPRFMETVRTILTELHAESAVIAEEMRTVSPAIFHDLQEALEQTPIEFVTHQHFKEMLNFRTVAAVIRTGEFTPYANVMLVSGVDF